MIKNLRFTESIVQYWQFCAIHKWIETTNLTSIPKSDSLTIHNKKNSSRFSNPSRDLDTWNFFLQQIMQFNYHVKIWPELYRTALIHARTWIIKRLSANITHATLLRQTREKDHIWEVEVGVSREWRNGKNWTENWRTFRFNVADE